MAAPRGFGAAGSRGHRPRGMLRLEHGVLGASAEALWSARALAACEGDRAAAAGLASRVAACSRELASAGLGGAAPAVACAAVAPGRMRVFMGHTDFQGLGGPTVNACTAETLVVLAARPAADVAAGLGVGRVVAVNTDRAAFPRSVFRTADVWDAVRRHEGDPATRDEHAAGRATRVWPAGRWDSYLRALLGHLLSTAFEAHADFRAALTGPRATGTLYVAVDSTLPHRGGLSSSAALTTAWSLCAARALAGRDLTREQLLGCDRCEYYLGKPMGCGDRAAIVCSRAGCLSEIGSHPDGLLRVVPMPGDRLAVFEAVAPVPRLTSAEGRELLRGALGERRAAEAAAWADGIMERFGAAAFVDAVRHLREALGGGGASAGAAGLSAGDLASARDALGGGLLRELAAGGRLAELVPDARRRHALVLRLMLLLPDRPRAVALYGVSECERGRRYVEALGAGDVDEVLRLVRWAHNGDRAAVDYRAEGFPPTAWAAEADFCCGAADVARWADEGRDLASVCGAFQRSLPELDEAADLLHRRFGGAAQLRVAAAGLGGTACVHARAEVADGVVALLTERGWTCRRIAACAPARAL